MVQMQRKTAEQRKSERLKRLNATELQRKCAAVLADHAAEIATRAPNPADRPNRAADIWEPSLALADLAGRRWPDLARVGRDRVDSAGAGKQPDWVIVDGHLTGLRWGKLSGSSPGPGGRVDFGSRWALGPNSRKGKQVNEDMGGATVRPFGVKPRTIRIAGELGKGNGTYRDVHRYIPKAEVEAAKGDLVEGDPGKGGE